MIRKARQRHALGLREGRQNCGNCPAGAPPATRRSAGAKAGDLARKHGISEATLYNWKARFGGMDVADARKLRALEEENGKLKRLLADAMLDNTALKDMLSKK